MLLTILGQALQNVPLWLFFSILSRITNLWVRLSPVNVLMCYSFNHSSFFFFFFSGQHKVILHISFLMYIWSKYWKKKIQDSSPQLKFFTSFSMFCKLEVNLASQTTSFSKQIPPWRQADFLILAWIDSICLFSSCCGQLCWRSWCFSKEKGRKLF